MSRVCDSSSSSTSSSGSSDWEKLAVCVSIELAFSCATFGVVHATAAVSSYPCTNAPGLLLLLHDVPTTGGAAGDYVLYVRLLPAAAAPILLNTCWYMYTWCVGLVAQPGGYYFCYLHFALHPSERGLHQPDMLGKASKAAFPAACLLLAAACGCTRCQVQYQYVAGSIHIRLMSLALLLYRYSSTATIILLLCTYIRGTCNYQ